MCPITDNSQHSFIRHHCEGLTPLTETLRIAGNGLLALVKSGCADGKTIIMSRRSTRNVPRRNIGQRHPCRADRNPSPTNTPSLEDTEKPPDTADKSHDNGDLRRLEFQHLLTVQGTATPYTKRYRDHES